MNSRAHEISTALMKAVARSRRVRTKDSPDGQISTVPIDVDLLFAVATVIEKETRRSPSIEVVEVDGRQALLVSGGRLSKHAIEGLERFMRGEGKLVVLELEGTGGEPGYRETFVRDDDGKLVKQ